MQSSDKSYIVETFWLGFMTELLTFICSDMMAMFVGQFKVRKLGEPCNPVKILWGNTTIKSTTIIYMSIQHWL